MQAAHPMSKRLSRLGFVPTLVLSLALFLLGLLALNHVVDNWWPFDVGRLDLVRATAIDQVDAAAMMSAANPEAIFAFLAATMLTITGLFLPIAYMLNKRFGLRGSSSMPAFFVVLRQAMWVGIWATFCIWLQMNRLFGIAIALLVAAIFILLEFLLQVRTRATDATR